MLLTVLQSLQTWCWQYGQIIVHLFHNHSIKRWMKYFNRYQRWVFSPFTLGLVSVIIFLSSMIFRWDTGTLERFKNVEFSPGMIPCKTPLLIYEYACIDLFYYSEGCFIGHSDLSGILLQWKGSSSYDILAAWAARFVAIRAYPSVYSVAHDFSISTHPKLAWFPIFHDVAEFGFKWWVVPIMFLAKSCVVLDNLAS